LAEINIVAISNKVAVVTGASRGIGAAIAERPARDGLAVVVNDAGSVDAAEALVAKIETMRTRHHSPGRCEPSGGFYMRVRYG
jgi:NAD(P)-dependent dehydrogenase (short-subunit alcohol dehydrogenase family)